MAQATAEAVANSPEASRTLALGPPHVDVDDINYAVKVDAFAFAMRVHRVDGLHQLMPLSVGDA